MKILDMHTILRSTDKYSLHTTYNKSIKFHGKDVHFREHDVNIGILTYIYYYNIHARVCAGI